MRKEGSEEGRKERRKGGKEEQAIKNSNLCSTNSWHTVICLLSTQTLYVYTLRFS